jgi:c-di-GMP-binding flagellar brake protein YcgR
MLSYEKRQDVRYDMLLEIVYIIPDQGDDLRKAVTINISTGGLNVYIFDSLALCQEVIIRSPLPFDRNRAAVHWIKKEAEGFYKAGLKFMSTQPTHCLKNTAFPR